MAEVRACFTFFVIFLCFHKTIAQPFFGDFLCDLFCDGDSSDDDYDLCSGCDDDSEKATTANPSAAMSSSSQGPVHVVLPPANGLNVTLSKDGDSWWLNLLPWAGGSSATPAGAAAPAATTSAPAATTAAAGATTAAAGATTAAPTTAAG